MKPAIAVSVAALLSLPTATHGDDWPMLGHDVARGGGTATEIRPPFLRKWYRLFPDEGIQTGVQPVIAEGRVFLGTLGGVLHAIDSRTGKDSWTYRAGAPILHAAAVDSGKVFFGAADGSVQALNCSNGTLLWKSRTGAAIWNAPAAHDGVLLVGSRDGRLYAFESGTGKIRWSADLGAPVLNSPAIDAKLRRVYVGSEAMRVHALTLRDGKELWHSEPLPGSSMRGYHPVIAPDGSVMVTTAPVIGYDRFQELMIEMVRDVFGDFASWRHTKEENDRLRAENFRLMEKPETYDAQLEFLRKRLTSDPDFQTFFVLDRETGQPRFVAPIVASESMNGPGAPPLVTPEGRVIVKYQVLLRSRYEHYSPFLNIGYLDTRTGQIQPIMDQTRTYGWHDSLLLVHDEQCQLSLVGRVLINTHQDNVNAMNLETLKGFPQPLAINVHEPAPGQAMAIRTEAWRGHELPPGEEWLIRGTAVYGGGSVLDVPVAIAGDSFYYLPTHELNSGCALVAYKSAAGAADPKRTPIQAPPLTTGEWKQLQDMPWDWDTLNNSRLTNFLASLPGPVPGSSSAPLFSDAQRNVANIRDASLDKLIWEPAVDPARDAVLPNDSELALKLQSAIGELITTRWRPLVTPAAKAPEHAYRFFNDPSETLYTLLLARPFLSPALQGAVDAHISELLAPDLARAYPPDEGQTRALYRSPSTRMPIVDDPVRDELARCYVLWLWSRTPTASGFAAKHWKQLRPRIRTPAPRFDDDCGNARLAGLIGYCRLAKDAGDRAAVDEALPLTRQAMRERLSYELAHTRGGLIRTLPQGRSVFARWRHLTPDVARLIRIHARPIQERLMANYVDYLRPGWWIAWNVEQMMRNEAPYQMPSTPHEIFSARALILGEFAAKLSRYVDLAWCRGDEYFIQKLALTLRASAE